MVQTRKRVFEAFKVLNFSSFTNVYTPVGNSGRCWAERRMMVAARREREARNKSFSIYTNNPRIRVSDFQKVSAHTLNFFPFLLFNKKLKRSKVRWQICLARKVLFCNLLYPVIQIIPFSLSHNGYQQYLRSLSRAQGRQ